MARKVLLCNIDSFILHLNSICCWRLSTFRGLSSPQDVVILASARDNNTGNVAAAL